MEITTVYFTMETRFVCRVLCENKGNGQNWHKYTIRYRLYSIDLIFRYFVFTQVNMYTCEIAVWGSLSRHQIDILKRAQKQTNTQSKR